MASDVKYLFNVIVTINRVRFVSGISLFGRKHKKGGIEEVKEAHPHMAPGGVHVLQVFRCLGTASNGLNHPIIFFFSIYLFIKK